MVSQGAVIHELRNSMQRLLQATKYAEITAPCGAMTCPFSGCFRGIQESFNSVSWGFRVLHVISQCIFWGSRALQGILEAPKIS